MGEITAFLVMDSRDSVETEKTRGAEERKELLLDECPGAGKKRWSTVADFSLLPAWARGIGRRR